MKSRMFAMFSSLALLTAGASLAQSSRPMKADIPFEFRVGEKLLPAGHYDIRVGADTGIVTIRNGHDGAMTTTYAVGAKSKLDTGKLVFKRYGRSYFLSTVCSPANSTGRQLNAPKAQREWALTNLPDAIVEVALATK